MNVTRLVSLPVRCSRAEPFSDIGQQNDHMANAGPDCGQREGWLRPLADRSRHARCTGSRSAGPYTNGPSPSPEHMRPTFLSAAVASALIPAFSASAQQPMTIVDSYDRARQLIEAAVAAHGGADALAAARQMRLTARGYEYQMQQSRRVAPPLDSTVMDLVLMTDIARGRVVYQDTRGYPGGFYYTNRRITNGTEGFAVDVRNRRYSTTQTQPATETHGDLFILPQLRLLPVHRGAGSSLRSLGRMRLASGAEVDVITARLPSGFMTTLGFDPATHRLHALVSPGADLLLGDHAVETEFLNYRMLDGVLLPTEWVTRRGGIVINRYRYTSATLGYQIPDSLLRPPPHFTLAPALA